MDHNESTKNTGGDGARPCAGQRRPYRHHNRAHGVRLRSPQLVPLSAEQEDEALGLLVELVARHRDGAGS